MTRIRFGNFQQNTPSHMQPTYVSASVFVRVENKQLITIETRRRQQPTHSDYMLCFGARRLHTEHDSWHTALRELARKLGVEPIELTDLHPTSKFEVPQIQSNEIQVFYVLDITQAQASNYLASKNRNQLQHCEKIKVLPLNTRLEAAPLFGFHRYVLKQALARQHLVLVK